MTVSGAGLYVGHHIAYLQIEKAAGAKFKYVPHKGGAPRDEIGPRRAR